MLSEHINLIMIVTGILTSAMILQFFFPDFVLNIGYGEKLNSDAARLIVRHWGVLIFCFGMLIVWAANRPEIRVPVLFAAIVEKVVLVACILLSSVRTKPIPLVIVGGDTLMVAV